MSVEIEKRNLKERLIKAIPVLEKRITGIVHDSNDVADILQDSLYAAISKLTELKEPYNLEAWMMKIAHNKCMDYFKRKKKFIPLDEIIMQNQSMNNKVISISESEHEYLINGIGNLSGPLRTVIQMKYFTHNSIKEISRYLNVPEGTIKRRLFDARNKLRKEFTMKEKTNIKPKIIITEVVNPTVSKVKLAGYGLFFGAPFKGINDVELVDKYDYPGEIFMGRTVCKVTRKTTMLGHEVWEVVNTYDKNDIENNRHLYYTLTEESISMVLRILNFPPEVRVDLPGDNMPKWSRIVKVGEFINKKDSEYRIVDVVNVKIGEKEYKNVIRQRDSCDDFHGRYYGEYYLNTDGREILHRDYLGKDWKMGGSVTWDKWKDSPEIRFRDESFRLMSEFFLVDHYTDSE